MADVQRAPSTVQQATGDFEIRRPQATARFGRLFVGLIVVLVVIGVGVWQILTLHHRLDQVQRAARTQSLQLQQSHEQLKTLQNSVSAAVGCLEVAKPQPTLCTHFLP